MSVNNKSNSSSFIPLDAVLLTLAFSTLTYFFSSIGYDAFYILFVLSLSGAFFVKRYLPFAAEVLKLSGLAGKDLNKPNQPLLAESLGALIGAIYLIILFLFIPVPFYPPSAPSLLHGIPNFPRSKFTDYIAAILSICCMLFLGFADDVLALKWRYKVVLPAIASLPMLLIYAVGEGTTVIIIPRFLQSFFGRLFDLGILYYFYMAAFSIFCTNAINILAGINGLEVGQTIIIACSIIGNNLWQLTYGDEPTANHLLSLFINIPLISVCLPALKFNWWPSRGFVGDTFCYFAGMTIAVSGILGHFSKTLLLFLMPQTFNFVYSIPQIFGLVPCPRHRMPKFDVKSGLLEPSLFQVPSSFIVKNAHLSLWQTLGKLTFKTLKSLHLVKVAVIDGQTYCSNLTLINLVLVLRNQPMREDRLTMTLLLIQVICSMIGFTMRYKLVHFLY